MDVSKKKTDGSGPGADDVAFGSNSEIARKLRSYSASLVKDEVPDRFADLLSKLESAEAEKTQD